MSTYLERALVVVAPQNFGKNTLLRSMFNDPRLGNNGEIPKARRLRDVVRLSGERRLYLRLTSPHEGGETLGEFIGKTNSKMVDGRWCFAGRCIPNRQKICRPQLPPFNISSKISTRSGCGPCFCGLATIVTMTIFLVQTS